MDDILKHNQINKNQKQTVNPEFCIWQKYPKSEIKAFLN